MIRKDEKLKSIVREAAAEFFLRESNKTALLTVTGTAIEEKGRRAVIFITVYPDSAEKNALAFAKRKRTELLQCLKERFKLERLTRVEVSLDAGEKNRQRIDRLSDAS